MSTTIHVETVTSPTNIACIKYWGKADKEFNTPINSSVSVTLDQDDLRSITSVAASKSFIADRLWLNGNELQMNDLEKNPHANRFLTCVREMRKLARDRVDRETGEVTIKASEWGDYHIHVVSKNTFPTAAGLASSAAGYACLVFALANLFNVPIDEEGLSELSVIARQGSGSACRSLFGGFVRWQKGTAENGWKDSRAVPVASKESWADLETLILVANDAKKDTSSTSGMDQSVKTSPLLLYRAKEVVDKRLSNIEKAFKERDFATFGELTMADSNQFHATCLDTLPPIFYLNDTSRQIIRLVHAFNNFHGKVVAAYTFDAGPNAVIFVPRQHHKLLTAFMLHFFPASSSPSFCNRPDVLRSAAEVRGVEFDKLIAEGAKTGRVPKLGDVKMMYCTRIGDGPKRLADPKDCLIDQHGFPIHAAPTQQVEEKSASSEETDLTGQVSVLNEKVGGLERLLVSQSKFLVRLTQAAEFASTLLKVAVAAKVVSFAWHFSHQLMLNKRNYKL